MANSYRDLIAEAHQALEGLAPLTDLELRTAAVHGWVAHDTSAGERSNLWGQFAARASAELLAARARITELEAERPRFSQRQFMQALRDRDEAQSRAAELADRITELEKQAKAGEQFDALLSLMAWRCTSTTTMANTIPGDDRAVWCTLPKGHAGMHHGEMPQCVPTGIEGFSKQEPMGMDWPEVSDR